MKAELPPPPEHHSYKVHRTQVVNQIVLPVVISTLLIFVMIGIIIRSTFYEGGDVGRWAAISTMWILIPVIIAGLLLLAILIGLIYLMARGLQLLPRYTGIAQDYVYLARTYIIRAAKAIEKPVHAILNFSEQVQEFFRKVIPQ